MRFVFSFLLFISATISAKAQDSPLVKIPVADSAFPRHIISIGLGQSYWSAELKYDQKWRGYFQPQNTFEVAASPVYQVAYDLHVKKIISIGIVGAYQQVKVKQTFNFSGEPEREHTQQIRNAAITFRTLFHYGSDRLSMYSGFGLIYQRSELKHGLYPDKVNDPYADLDFYVPEDKYFTFQLMLFGMRAWIIQSLALRVEFTIGYPNYSAAGLSYRL